MERGRPIAIGNTSPGNSTTLRTRTMIRASAGKGGVEAVARLALSSDGLRRLASVTQHPPLSPMRTRDIHSIPTGAPCYSGRLAVARAARSGLAAVRADV